MSLRITNHNANADTYIIHNTNYPYNLSILVSKRFKKNKFKPNNEVKLDEYVYYGERLARVSNPLTQIINGIIQYLRIENTKILQVLPFLINLPNNILLLLMMWL